MRQIKFRAWHKIENRMYNVFCLDGNGNADLIGYRRKGKGDTADYDHIIIMQFTGLKDKNGKEIYEDDIYRDEFGNQQVIKYVAPSFSLVGATENRGKVIGNIYKNPELLGGEK